MPINPSIIGIKDTTEARINPATEEAQVVGNSSLSSIETDIGLIKTQTDKLTFTGTSLDVNITGGISSGAVDDDDNLISIGQTLPLNIPLLYAFNPEATYGGGPGPQWQRVVQNSNGLLVDGSGVTQPVSAASLPLPTGASTESKQDIGNTSLSSIDGKITTTVDGIKIDGSSVTQPISGTVTANIGTTNGLALDATLTDASQKTQIVDGSGNTISSTSNALDVNIKSGVTLAVDLTQTNDSVLVYGYDGSSNQPIKTNPSGEVSVNVISSDLPTGAATESTLSGIKADTDQLTFSSNRLLVDGSGVTQPVSGTVTSNQGGAPWDQNLTEVGGAPVSLGQKLSSGSIPVVLASDQSITIGDITVGTLDVTVPAISSTTNLTMSGDSAILELQGRSSASFSITGSWTGNLHSYVSPDNQATWIPVSFLINEFDGPTNVWQLKDTIDENQAGMMTAIEGMTHIKVEAISMSSGTANVVLSITNAPPALSWHLIPTFNTEGTLTNADDTVVTASDGRANVSFQINYTSWTGTLIFEATVNKTDWQPIFAFLTGASTTQTSYTNPSSGTIFRCVTSGFELVRCRLLTAGSGTVSIISSASSATSGVFLNIPLPNGDNIIGQVGIDQTTPGTTNKVSIGTDGVVASNQSGTWDINNISGTISLPTGAATESKQDTGNASLSSIDSKLNSLGQKTMANSVPVVISSDQSTVNTNPQDRVSREMGRVLASDLIITSESFSITSATFSNARPINGDIDVSHYKTKKIYVKNTSAFGGRYRITGSVDGAANYDVTLVADSALAGGNTSITDLTDAVTNIRIEVHSTTGTNTTTWVTKGYALGV